MNTKLFWENVNKRMKYERAQRLQRRRKAGVKRDSKSSQIDSEKQLQIECLLQVLEEYVTASLSQPDGKFDNDRLSEDIDIISIAVQKLKKDMAADMTVSDGIASETEGVYHADTPGLQLAMEVLDDLTDDSTTNGKNGERSFTFPLNSKEQEMEENKENSMNIEKLSESSSNIPSTSNKQNYGDDTKAAGAHLISTKDASDLTDDETKSIAPSSAELPQLFYTDINVAAERTFREAENEGKKEVSGFQDDLVESQGDLRATLEGRGNEDYDVVEKYSKMADRVEEIMEVAEENDVNDDFAAESPGAEKSEIRQKKDSYRLMKKTKFAINRKKTDKPSIWTRKLASRSQDQNFSQLEEDMRNEKPTVNLNGDKFLQKAISSLKKNLRQQSAEEGPNHEPLPPKLLNAVDLLDSAGT